MMGKRHSDEAVTTLRPPRPTSAPADAKVTPVLHPTDPQFTDSAAVRDGQAGPVTCSSCGCRLARSGEAWFHFNPIGGRDARGCRVVCADAVHDASGRAVSLAV